MKNCLELTKNIKTEELTKSRIILEQRSNHLKEMKNRIRLKPVTSEQVGPEFDKLDELSQAIKKL